ncbi:MAG: antibiotic biosynthesis monooxygenase [Xanthobacteraceae bacterium]|nr:antibiotic biosynthesis monooxygenase [Xanthobacteraceae bacterium]
MSHVIWVEFDLLDDVRAQFMELVRANAAISVRDEPGCSRFDVLEAPDGAGPVALYEIYDDEAAFRVHLASAHFKEFDARSAPLVRTKIVRSFRAYENAKA